LIKSQPWVHSWYADSLGFFLAPFLFIILAVFKLPPFSNTSPEAFSTIIFLVLFIDWAHIFAQYHRIYYNPVESKKLKWMYPLSYLLLIPLMALVVEYASVTYVDTALVYFVVFHFIKQHFGFIKIYSKTDGQKSNFDLKAENAFIYLSMFTPVIYWHTKAFSYEYKWVSMFIKSPYISYLLWPALILYGVTFLLYVKSEYARTKQNQLFNIPKNLSILSAILSWGLISILSDSTLLIIFTVTLSHDLSYTFYVWFIGRRDETIQKKKINWFTWWSVPGFFAYVAILVLFSHIIMVVHLELTKDLNWGYWIYGDLFNGIPKGNGFWLNVGWALFFATQAHHYFIDRYLWKREKDLDYMVKTGRIQLNDLS
jgi:hypothetical protein